MTASYYPTPAEVNMAAKVIEFCLVALEREVETAEVMVFALHVPPEREVGSHHRSPPPYPRAVSG